MKKIKDIDFTPINTQEEMLYGILLRLDALCNMGSAYMAYIAGKEGIATENHVETVKQEVSPDDVIEEKPKKKASTKSTRKRVKKDESNTTKK